MPSFFALSSAEVVLVFFLPLPWFGTAFVFEDASAVASVADTLDGVGLDNSDDFAAATLEAAAFSADFPCIIDGGTPRTGVGETNLPLTFVPDVIRSCTSAPSLFTAVDAFVIRFSLLCASPLCLASVIASKARSCTYVATRDTRP